MRQRAAARITDGGRRHGPALDFLRVLWSVNHGLESLSKRMKRTVGVSGRERFVLRVIGSQPGGSAGDAAALLHVDPSTLTGVLVRLVERGFVKRTTHPADARRAVLALTARGRAVDHLRTGTVEAHVGQALKRLDEAKVQAASEVLAQIAKALGEQRV